MVFSSHIFLFYFLPLTLLGYYALVAMRVNLSWINLFITIASYVFYGWFQPYFIILMWTTSFINFQPLFTRLRMRFYPIVNRLTAHT